MYIAALMLRSCFCPVPFKDNRRFPGGMILSSGYTVSSKIYTTKQRIDVFSLNVRNSILTHLNTSVNETILMHVDGWFPSFHEASGKKQRFKPQTSAKCEALHEIQAQ